MRTLPSFSFEKPLWKEKFTVIGIDEVGRGAFAGPIGIGGVVFDPQMNLKESKTLLALGIDDSKKLTPSKRKSLASIIIEYAYSYAVEFVDVSTINEIGIGKATFVGMKKVAEKLSENIKKPYLLMDAFKIPGVLLPQNGIIRGDNLSISIAAASILAKVERDKLMVELGLELPHYSFEQHKGYGTSKHRDAIKKYGQTEHHRKDFCRGVH